MSEKISQKQAVVNAVNVILGSTRDLSIPVTSVLNKTQIQQIRSSIFNGIKSGDIVFNKEFSDTELQQYVASMIANHFRKANELNGNSTYAPSSVRVAKTPKQQKEKKIKIKDSQIDALNLMLSKYDIGSDAYNKIQAAISNRIATLTNEKFDIDVTVTNK